MTTLPMNPIPVPPEAAATRSKLRAVNVGPPPGISDDECGTLECLVGFHDQGYPMFAGYWRPDAAQLAALQAGGFIELSMFAPRLVMHAMTVWSATPDEPVNGCSWVECDELGDHEHASTYDWVNPGDPTAGTIRVDVASDGTVQLSEAAVAQLLTDAGWERAR